MDYIIATGEAHTVREFVEKAAKYVGINLIWQGKGLKEKGIDKKTRKTIIEIDSKYFRPAEIDVLLGDSQKAKKDFGWESKIKFDELIKIMMQADLKKVNNKKVQ